MKSSLTFTTLRMPSAKMNGLSSLPAITDYRGRPDAEYGVSSLGFDEGLFIGYGRVASMFPYREQDLYSRELYDTDVRAVILENDYLKATFYPDMGGKLAGLYDKKGERELLVFNPVIRPCNLALLNAWTSGGIEYNCGPFGHHPLTCSTLHTAETHLDDGTPVLRFYEFERIRKIVYQMDFFLPQDSKMLFARMRYINPNTHVIPAYWWSNMAVPEVDGGRTIVPADSAYTPDENGLIALVPMPEFDGVDVTYPAKNPVAVDYFFKIPDRARKYEAEIGPDGKGFVQVSTSRLIGRKQFVWGQGPGGARWQQFLTSDDNREKYTEIQAGLAHSQYEHLPMPPRTAWEWLEGYGAIDADPEKIHSDWHTSRLETEEKLNAVISDDEMEKILEETKPMALSPADKVLTHGSGWGALENLRREKCGLEAMCPHLDFGMTGDEQDYWKALIDGAPLPEADPCGIIPSWMNDTYYTGLMENYLITHEGAPELDLLRVRLGMAYLVNDRRAEAREQFEKSISGSPSPWALFGLAKLAELDGDGDRHAELMLRAARMKPDDISLAREAFRALTETGKHSEALTLYDVIPEKVKADGRTMLYAIESLIKCGRLDEAEEKLMGNGGIVIPDIREGEVSLSDLWYELKEAEANRDGGTFDRTKVNPPASLDFRMKAAN